MRLIIISRQLTTNLVSALLLLALFQARETAAQFVCTPPPVPNTPVPETTVKIYNNSSESLYAVFETGLGPEDQWPDAGKKK